jgi:hypothetical protein
MSIAERFDFLVEKLSSERPRDRVYALRAIDMQPIADRRLLAAVERLLDDQTIAQLGIPYSFGEVRLLAARAVAALRWTLGINETVRLEGVIGPYSGNEAARLTQAAGVTSDKSGVDGQLDKLRQLQAMDKLPRRNIVCDPKHYSPEPNDHG